MLMLWLQGIMICLMLMLWLPANGNRSTTPTTKDGRNEGKRPKRGRQRWRQRCIPPPYLAATATISNGGHYPTRSQQPAGVTFTRRYGGKPSSSLLGISRLYRRCRSIGSLPSGQISPSTLQPRIQLVDRNDSCTSQLSRSAPPIATTGNF